MPQPRYTRCRVPPKAGRCVEQRSYNLPASTQHQHTAHLPSLTADASNSYHPACGEHAAWTTANQLEPSCCAPATPNQDAHMHPLQCCPGAFFLAFNIPSFLPSMHTDRQQSTATPTTKMAASGPGSLCAHTWAVPNPHQQPVHTRSCTFRQVVCWAGV